MACVIGSSVFCQGIEGSENHFCLRVLFCAMCVVGNIGLSHIAEMIVLGILG